MRPSLLRGQCSDDSAITRHMDNTSPASAPTQRKTRARVCLCCASVHSNSVTGHRAADDCVWSHPHAHAHTREGTGHLHSLRQERCANGGVARRREDVLYIAKRDARLACKGRSFQNTPDPPAGTGHAPTAESPSRTTLASKFMAGASAIHERRIRCPAQTLQRNVAFTGRAVAASPLHSIPRYSH